MKSMTLLLAALIASVGSLAQAQNLTLFEAVEMSPDLPSAPRPALQAALTQDGNPAFSLRSISRFGDDFHGVLLDRGGNRVDVRWRAGDQVELPGMSGHVVVEANSRQVVVQHSNNDRCVVSEITGVSCRSANESVLSLATMSPLQAMPQQQQQQPGGGGPGQLGAQIQGPFQGRASQGNNTIMLEGGQAMVIDQDGNRMVINPFVDAAIAGPQPIDPEMVSRMDRARARNTERINAADLPANMRMVRTPFGDRLVPVRE